MIKLGYNTKWYFTKAQALEFSLRNDALVFLKENSDEGEVIEQEFYEFCDSYPIAGKQKSAMSVYAEENSQIEESLLCGEEEIATLGDSTDQH